MKVVNDELDSIEEVVNEIPEGADEEVTDEVSTSVLEINKRLTSFIHRRRTWRSIIMPKLRMRRRPKKILLTTFT